VFSQLARMLALIREELLGKGVGPVTLTHHARSAKKKPIDAFEKGRAEVFLISLKAGGAGLNMTSADTVIHYDPWWNPAVQAHATGSRDRIGHKKPVLAFSLTTAARSRSACSACSGASRATCATINSRSMIATPVTDPTTATAMGPSDLVGRSRERAELLEALADAARGRGRLVLLAGEGGMGKTRLCEEVEAAARRQDFAVAWGHAVDGGAPRYWMWTQVVRSLVRGADVAGTMRALGPAATALAMLAPELGGAAAIAAPATDDDLGSSYGLAHALATLLRTVAERQPLLLVLEDLHAALPSTVRLLHLVSFELRDARVLVVATYRDPDARLAPGLAAILVELGRRATTLTLQRMDRADIAAIMGQVVGQALPKAIAAALYDRSAGNPFFARELARQLTCADPTMSGALAASRTMPVAIADIVMGPLDLLSADAREVLAIAAIGGHELALALIAQVSQWSLARCREAADEAARARLVVIHDDARVSFAHSLLRDAIYRSVPTVRRATLHFDLARALEPTYAGAAEPRFAELAHHFGLGAAIGGHEKVVQYHRLAGERAALRLAFDDAVRHFGSALAADDGGHDGRYGDLLVALGDAQLAIGQTTVAHETLDAAVELARRLPSAGLLGRVALVLARRTPPGRASPRLVRLGVEALAVLGDDALARCQLLARLSAEPDAGPADHRAALARQAISIARGDNDPQALASVLLWSHDATATVDNVEERLASSAEVEAIGVRLGRRDLALAALPAQLVARMELGDHEGAASTLARLTRRADELVSPMHRWRALANAAMMEQARGRFDDAERLANAAVAMEDAHDPAHDAGSDHLLLLWRLRRAQGRLAELATRLEIKATESPRPVWRIARADARLAAGDPDAARADLHRLAADDATWSREPSWLGEVVAATEVACALGDLELARWFGGRLAPYATRHAILGRGAASLGPVTVALATVAALGGAPVRARRAPSTPPVARGDLAMRPARGGADWLIGFPGAELAVRDSKGMRYLYELVEHPGDELHVAELVRRADGVIVPAEAPVPTAATGPEIERMRQSVTKRVRDAIRRIGEQDPGVAQHLERSVRTGAICVYVPPLATKQQ